MWWKKLQLKLNESVEKPIRIYFLFSLFDLAFGTVALIVYSILTVEYGVTWVRNQFLGTHLSLLIVFYSAQSLHIQTKVWRRARHFVHDCVFVLASLLLQFLLLVFYSMAHKIDVAIWSFYLFAVQLTNTYILFVLRRPDKAKLRAARYNEVYNANNPEMSVDNGEGEDQASRNYRWLMRTVEFLNAISRTFFIVVTCFLLNGAIRDGMGNTEYRADTRGQLLSINKNDGSVWIDIQYNCEFPSSTLGAQQQQQNKQNVFMFEANSSVGGVAEFGEVQRLLKNRGRSSCVWDKPGSGLSDYLLSAWDHASYMEMYDQLILQISSLVPVGNLATDTNLTFVGWGRGAELLYEYAITKKKPTVPQLVHSLVFLDTLPTNAEYEIEAKLERLDSEKLEDYRETEQSKQMRHLKWTNGVMVPFGLKSSFDDENLRKPNSRTKFDQEIEWRSRTEKRWMAEEYWLNENIKIKDENDVSPFFSNHKNNNNTNRTTTSIPIYMFLSRWSDQQVREITCAQQNWSPDSAECLKEVRRNKLVIETKEKLLDLSQQSKQGKLIECTQNECDGEDYLILNGRGASFTVDKLLELFP